MGDHFDDYPQSGGQGSSDWRSDARTVRNAAIAESQRKTMAWRLWRTAQDFLVALNDPRPLPCGEDEAIEYIPQLEAIVRELDPQIATWRYDVNEIFRVLGLAPLAAQQEA